MNILFPDYTLQISAPDQFAHPEDTLGYPGHTWHGAAILWHETLNHMVTSIGNVHDRFTSVKVTSEEQNILLISAYLPTSGKDNEFMECLGELAAFIDDNSESGTTILIGLDSNCSDKSTKRRSTNLDQFCEDHDLIKVMAPGPTFHHANGVYTSNIDYFLISQPSPVTISEVSLQCTQDHPQNLSSHDPILATLSMPILVQPHKQSKYKHTYTEFKQTRVIWPQVQSPEYQSLAEKALLDCERYFPTSEFLPLKCQLYSDLLVKAAELSLDTKPSQVKAKPRPAPQVHHAWKHFRKYFNIWKKEGKPRDPNLTCYRHYKESRAIFQQVRRHQDNLKTVRMNNLMMHTNSWDKNKYYSMIRTMRGQSKKHKLQELHTPAGVYYGQDILEGFAKDAELLAEFVGESKEYDNDFYRLCILDNHFIFSFKDETDMKLPEMKIEDLDKIIDKEMKNGKACDIYKLTAEHLKHCGTGAKHVILRLINSILDQIYFLSCPQIKTGLGIAAHKGKKKTLTLSSSYRRITVTPQLGSIIDRFLDPVAEKVFRRVQSSEQYGFTEGISYLAAAVLRGECQRYALDTKQTCFGISFDGKAAFPSVDRDIQLRELYSCGESGDLLRYSKNTYENTVCRMKQDGHLSREIREWKGSRQGHKRASGHFKSYVNPCLVTADSSGLGFYIGTICVSAVCVADDTYILSGDPRKLQGLIDIIGHYGRRYRIIFNADKTKVTITGSKHDIKYYEDIKIWSLYGETLTVAENNDHLGLIVSGTDEEIKNVDKNIKAARNTLFGFLGNIFSYRCKLSVSLQYNTWQVYVKPVLCTGLSALPVRPTVVATLRSFHHKILRSILKLSPYSPVAPLYFLLGELPIEASLHLGVLALFWNIWSNPETKAFEVVQYLLKMADSSSLTWSAHVRLLFQMYQLPDPLALLRTSPWPKQRWKDHTKVAVTSYHESALRQQAAQNTKLQFLNIQTIGLSARPHPVVAWAVTTQDVVTIRPHIKLLSGDYLCYSQLAHDRGTDPHCRLCQNFAPLTDPTQTPAEDTVHLITQCKATRDTRDRHLPDLLNTVADHHPTNILLSNPSHFQLTQFILDCTSLNLPNDMRIAANHPGFIRITMHCSKLIFAIHNDRSKQLKTLKCITK